MLGKKYLKDLSRHGPLRVLKRYVIWSQYAFKSVSLGFLWPWRKTEDSNFYYRLSESSETELAQFVSVVTRVSLERVRDLFNELKTDELAQLLVREFLDRNRGMMDSELEFGRRLGWYAMIRILRPAKVLETGVHNGLGGLAILCALRRNSQEGTPGSYIGTDFNQKAGEIFRGSSLEELGTVVFGDSIESIGTVSEELDFVITDSNHSDGYESRELLSIEPLLSAKAWVISDNAHATNVLQRWSVARGRNYLVFRETPDHWSPGAAIGLSWSNDDNIL